MTSHGFPYDIRRNFAPSPHAGKAFRERGELMVAEDVQAGEQVGTTGAAHGKLALPEAHHIAVEHRDGVEIKATAIK